MMLAGLRLSEVINLKSQDVDLVNKAITVRNGKWGKDRMIPINARLNYYLQEYYRWRNCKHTNTAHFFLAICRSQPLCARGVQTICRKVRTSSGVSFSPQVLRHTFATLTYEGSKDIYAVSGMLGHSNIKTTQIYAHLSLQSMRDSADRHVLNDPLGRKPVS